MTPKTPHNNPIAVLHLAAFKMALISLAFAATATEAAAAVNPPVYRAGSALSEDGKKVVLIYLANESSESMEVQENKRAFESMLNASGTRIGRLLADRIAADGPAFASAVDSEVEALVEMLPKSPLASSTGAFVATNRSLSQNQVLVYKPGHSAPEWLPFAVEPSDDPILKSHPLSRVEVFSSLLAEAARQFDPADHKFVLTTKSHGGKENIMSLLLGIQHQEIDPDSFVDDLKRKDRRMFDKVLGPDPEKPRTDVLGTMQASRGISRSQYLATLEDAGRVLKMEFSLVFAESCSSGIGFTRETKLPENIGFLFTSDQTGLFYQTIPYRSLLLQSDAPLDHLIFGSLKNR